MFPKAMYQDFSTRTSFHSTLRSKLCFCQKEEKMEMNFTEPHRTPLRVEDLPLRVTSGKPTYLLRLALHQEALRLSTSSATAGGGSTGSGSGVGYIEPFSCRSVVHPTQRPAIQNPADKVRTPTQPHKEKESRKPRAKGTGSQPSSKLSSPNLGKTRSLPSSPLRPQQSGNFAPIASRNPHPSATPFRVPVSYSTLPDLEDLDSSPNSQQRSVSYMQQLQRLHGFCEVEEKDCYLDPVTGELVFAANFLRKSGRCCGHRCRHCPFKILSSEDAVEFCTSSEDDDAESRSEDSWNSSSSSTSDSN